MLVNPGRSENYVLDRKVTIFETLLVKKKEILLEVDGVNIKNSNAPVEAGADTSIGSSIFKGGNSKYNYNIRNLKLFENK